MQSPILFSFTFYILFNETVYTIVVSHRSRVFVCYEALWNRYNIIPNVDLNWLEISENEIENVIGEVNKEMKLDGWILMELKNEECLIMNKELEEEYLLNKNKVLKMKEWNETRNQIQLYIYNNNSLLTKRI